jgi:hypothetical protein
MYIKPVCTSDCGNNYVSALDSFINPVDHPDKARAQELVEQFRARKTSVYTMRMLPGFKCGSIADGAMQIMNPIMLWLSSWKVRLVSI